MKIFSLPNGETVWLCATCGHANSHFDVDCSTPGCSGPDELPGSAPFLDGSRCEVTGADLGTLLDKMSGGTNADILSPAIADPIASFGDGGSSDPAGHVTPRLSHAFLCPLIPDPTQELVLSTFPGIDLLGRGFEHVGFPVVLGPDLLWDRRIEDFHIPAGRFTGIIGGPPCQNYSDANRNRNTEEGDRLVRHYLRIVTEGQPDWFLMENVRNVPDVVVPGYTIQRLDITDAACGGKQRRLRHIQFGSRFGHIIRPARTEEARPVTPAVLTRMASKHDRHSRRLARQSAPRLPLKALTSAARARGIGNAVPWLVSIALAQAVASRGPVTPEDCCCGCGRATKPGARHGSVACRKRMERRRKGLGRSISWEEVRGPGSEVSQS